MNKISMRYEHAHVCQEDIARLGAQLAPEIARISAAWGAGYDSDYASLSLPTDTKLHQSVALLADVKKRLNPSMLIVIGIGGSNLGTIAVHEALQGLLYNAINPFKIYFADTVDSSEIKSMLALMDQEFRDGHTVLLAIISKSGTTTETIANAQVFIDRLKKNQPENYHEYVVAITDENSVLWQRAQQERWDKLAIPAHVGGRYSVFSAVGLFPLAMLGIDIMQLVSGAQSVKKACLSDDIATNPAALSAICLFANHRKNIHIHDTFIFAKQLKGIGSWYRQLMAESIGKSESRTGNIINEGITPTVSVGSTDLHSVAQLYLAGPYDMFTTFLSVAKLPVDIKLPNESPLIDMVDHLQDKTFNGIMRAILQGTQQAYVQSKRPFITIELPEITAYYVGQLLQAKMVEIMYLGFLLEVNPFDQPQVELYKKETRKILAHE